MREKLKVGVIGASGYVGQRFVALLQNHPWFTLTKLAASAKSAGKTYKEAIQARQHDFLQVSEKVASIVMEVVNPATAKEFAEGLDLCFCAVDMKKEDIIQLEEALAKEELVVISNNSANRWTEDVPMIIPEINPEHRALIEAQKKRLGTKNGFIACKPNCSIQSYVPALHALRSYGIEKVFVSTYQAISGAGKTFDTWPEMMGNVIPFISGEEEKSEKEPLKIWGRVEDGKLVIDRDTQISAHCFRVPVQDGHTASVTVKFTKKPSKEEILEAWENYDTGLGQYNLPTSPKRFLHYYEEENRPQVQLDVQSDKGMAIHIGRLREDSILDYQFACLSHNTLRGAAGGAVLSAELLVAMGEIKKR